MAGVRRRDTLIIGAGLALASAPVFARAAAAYPGPEMTLGLAKAPVHVVEYLSVSCSHCAHFNEEVFPTMKAKYIDTGKVRWTYRELLTPPQQVAAAGFLTARCAGPGKYFNVVDEILRSQSRWQTGNIKPIFVEIAQNNGLTEAQFEACLRDEKALEALEARVRYGIEVDKVNGTPSFFVNGKRMTGSTVPTVADMDAAIAAAAKGGRR
ncbi:DsbA family protein [Phenylobacterium sp. VNQ135]|uniref:DsbA family protein n=1 Tax=Phenylobacterium sp. VNQ135 TaxID=3400922 RepID=UPI003C0637AD